MQTNFSQRQLSDPHTAEADRILRSCIHCGLCTANCPTYVLLGDERDGPRGRIDFIKDMMEEDKRPSNETRTHIDRCLSCLACMSACPSRVDFMHLMTIARMRMEKLRARGLKERVLRRFLAAVLPEPKRFRMALTAANIIRPLQPMFQKLGLVSLVALLQLAPKRRPPRPKYSGPGTAATTGERRKRVILLGGCTQLVLRPQINDATIRLLARRGVDVEVAAHTGCCGELASQLGRHGDAIAHAKRNIDAWWRVFEKGRVDAIIMNTSGCGTMVKDYAYLLRNVANYGMRAERVSQLACDITEFLAGYDMGPPKRWSSLKVAYHAACAMEHGQEVRSEPRTLLQDAGYAIAEVPDGGICCGAAGSYNVLQPDLANKLRDRKIVGIESVRPDLVATGNIGCITHLQNQTELPFVHTVELLDWAYGGPVPLGLERFKEFVSEVPEATLSETELELEHG